MTFGRLGSAKLVVNADNRYTIHLTPSLVTAEHERNIWIIREESQMGIPVEGVGMVSPPCNSVDVRTNVIPPVEFFRPDHDIAVEGVGKVTPSRNLTRLEDRTNVIPPVELFPKSEASSSSNIPSDARSNRDSTDQPAELTEAEIKRIHLHL